MARYSIQKRTREWGDLLHEFLAVISSASVNRAIFSFLFQWSVEFLRAFYFQSWNQKVYMYLAFMWIPNLMLNTESKPYFNDGSRRKFCSKISLHSDVTQMKNGLNREDKHHCNSSPDECDVLLVLTSIFCEYGGFCVSDLHQWIYGNKLIFHNPCCYSLHFSLVAHCFVALTNVIRISRNIGLNHWNFFLVNCYWFPFVFAESMFWEI